MNFIYKSIADLKGKWNIAIIIAIVVTMLPGIFNTVNLTAGLLTMLVVSGPLKLSHAIFNLKVIRNQDLSLNVISEGFKNFKSALGVFLLTTIFVVLGCVLFLIPGIIVMIRLSMVYFILSENPELEPLEVLNRSNALMKGKEFQLISKLFPLFVAILIGVSLVLTGVTFAGILMVPINVILYVALANFYESIK